MQDCFDKKWPCIFFAFYLHFSCTIQKKAVPLRRKVKICSQNMAIGWVVAMVICCGCTAHRECVEVSDTEKFRDGDMVLRCGMGAESRAVVQRSNSSFSHIGILQFDSVEGEWMVIHAVPGESVAGEPEYLKCEPIEAFYSPMRAQRGAWMRIDCTEETASRAAAYCRRKAEERVVFDNDYLLSDTTELYCCELVWLAYMREGIDISSGGRYEVPTVICKEGECIFPCNIENGKNTLFVKHFKTKQL